MSISSWETDPTGRHQYRWYDGERWTDQVADDGVQSVNPVSIPEARLPFKMSVPEPPKPVPPPPAQPSPEDPPLDPATPEATSAESTPPVPPPIETDTDDVYAAPAAGYTQAKFTTASGGRRFGGFLLDCLLFVVTAGIGWVIWSLIVYSRGQSPAKQVLKMRVIVPGDGPSDHRVAGWGSMALRELVLKWIPLTVLGGVFMLGLIWIIVNGIVMVNNDSKQALWDKAVKTMVVHDPLGLLRPENLAQPPQ